MLDTAPTEAQPGDVILVTRTSRFDNPILPTRGIVLERAVC